MRNTAQRGLVGHTAVLHALVLCGYEVLIPWGDHYPYDLAIVIISADGALKLLRIQCKVARLSVDKRFITFNAFRVSPGDNGRRSIKRGYGGEAELFGVYSPATENVYLVPVDAAPGATDYRLRLLPSKNNQEVGIHWAKDYEITPTKGLEPPT